MGGYCVCRERKQMFQSDSVSDLPINDLLELLIYGHSVLPDMSSTTIKKLKGVCGYASRELVYKNKRTGYKQYGTSVVANSLSEIEAILEIFNSDRYGTFLHYRDEVKELRDCICTNAEIIASELLQSRPYRCTVNANGVTMMTLSTVYSHGSQGAALKSFSYSHYSVDLMAMRQAVAWLLVVDCKTLMQFKDLRYRESEETDDRIGYPESFHFYDYLMPGASFEGFRKVCAPLSATTTKPLL